MQYEIISEDYTSNCMIEAIKAKLRDHQVKILFCKPRITENGSFQSFHFMWEDENGSYDFSEPEAAGLRNAFARFVRVISCMSGKRSLNLKIIFTIRQMGDMKDLKN